MQRKKSKVKKDVKAKTATVTKVIAKREPRIVASEPCCPRCGERDALVLEWSATSGVRRYLCVSETCKSKSVRGKGRRFVVPVGKSNCRNK